MIKYRTTFAFIIASLILVVVWFQGAINECSKPILNNDSVSALFSGLAIIGLVITILIQQKQISDAKQDLESQKQTDLIVRFENIFFKLFDMYITSKEDLRYQGEAEKITHNPRYIAGSTNPEHRLLNREIKLFDEHVGLQFFDMLFSIFSNIYFDDLDEPYGIQLLNFCFNRFKLRMSLYHGKLNILLGYIINSELKREQKLYYFRIIFQQMHMHEASWLMAYSLGLDKSSNIFTMFKEFPELRENAPNFHKWGHILQ